MTEKKTKLENMFEENKEQYIEADEKHLKEMNYSRKQLQLDLEQLKLWLKDQHHLPECRLTEKDNFLTMYITGCKGSLETVKRKLDAYYSLRGKSVIYKDRDPLDKDYRTFSNNCYMNNIIKPTEKGEIIFASRLSDNFGEIPPNAMVNAMKRIINVVEISMRFEVVSLKTIIIIDYNRYTASIAALYTPAIFKDILHIIQNVFPVRIGKLIFFNVPPVFEFVLNSVVKPFLSKKLQERLIVTSQGCDFLLKYVDKANLPKDWHGDYPLTLQEMDEIWSEYEIANRDWFIKELCQETDETKRVDTKMKYIREDSTFGVQGTLKKLAID